MLFAHLDVVSIELLCCRQSIIAEVESTLVPQYAQMPQEELHQWHANLQQSLSETSDQHHKAKDYLKQVISLKTSCDMHCLLSAFTCLPHASNAKVDRRSGVFNLQVDAARALARDAYRADQASIEKQKTWKSRVGELKEAQDNLRITKEAFYR